MTRTGAALRFLLFGLLFLCLPIVFLFARAMSVGPKPVVPKPVPVSGNVAPVSPRRVLVAMNTRHSESRALLAAWSEKRGIPANNILRLSCPITDEITRTDYRTQIENFIRRRALADPEIDYVVLGPGFPFRFSDFGNNGGYAVDSVLATCLMSPRPSGKRSNPYFGKNERFRRAKFGNLLLVTRIDGINNAAIKRLVDSSLTAKPVDGPFYLRDSFVMGMKAASEGLTKRGFVTDWIEGYNNDIFPRYEGLSGPYMAHWGAGPHDTQFSDEEFAAMKFLPGAIADLTWSVSAQQIRSAASKGNIAILTSNGAAGVQGYVSEPFADTISLPEIVLDRYTRGYNLAESFAMGSRYIHWKSLVLGDPLCAPYADPSAMEAGK